MYLSDKNNYTYKNDENISFTVNVQNLKYLISIAPLLKNELSTFSSAHSRSIYNSYI